jgi:membrane fusion protein, peptide pheromone/bacteriocin exporter
MRINAQIDAFNYNEWGMMPGTVADIAGDFVLMENKPVFKVRCRLEKQTLQLKNGYTARLKKGMTLRTRFVVTRRSLFQLLYDKADDWLNPAAQ